MSDRTNAFDFRTLVQNDLLASVVVFLVALPLCMGIAIASGAPPAAGLVTGIIGGLVVGFIAGSPLQVSGPAAGLSVIVWELIQTHGYGPLGWIVLVGGAVGSGGFAQVQAKRLEVEEVIRGMRAEGSIEQWQEARLRAELESDMLADDGDPDLEGLLHV